MMQLRLGVLLSLSVFSLAGCNALGLSNGSLDYKDTTRLAELQYPEGVMSRPTTPLYPTPTVEQLAIDHAPVFEDKHGKRFELPRPTMSKAPLVQRTDVQASVQRPQAIVDGNGNPLLKIDGNSATIWQYTLATLSSLNYQVTQNAQASELVIKVDNIAYILRLSAIGTSYNLAMFNTDNTFADPEIAANVLTQIYQNWPA